MTPPTAHTDRRSSPSPPVRLVRPRPRPASEGVRLIVASVRQALDVLAVVVGVGLAVLLASSGAPARPIALAVFAVAVLVLLDPRRTFRAWQTTGWLDSAARAAASTAVAAMLAIAAGVLAGDAQPDANSLRLWLFTTALLCALRGAATLAERHARRRGMLTIPTLIVGAGSVGAWVVRRLRQQSALGLTPIGFLDANPPANIEAELGLPILGRPSDVVEVARRHGAQQVIVAFSLERDHALAEAVKRCHEAGLAVAAVPRLFESISDRAVLDHVGGLPLMSFEPISPHGWQFALKHTIDRLVALVACLILAPALLAIALLVKLSSPGPVIYRQRRVGRGGREFHLLKFRSMASAPDGQASAGRRAFSPRRGLAPGGVEGADRRTRIGRWLRSASLDELPQLLNVLRGEMSLIGPRPERPEFVARYGNEVPRYDERHRVRPGITGWAQVNGLRGQTSIEDRVEWDNHYIDNWSPALELRSLALTIAAVLRFREDRRTTLAAVPGPLAAMSDPTDPVPGPPDPDAGPPATSAPDPGSGPAPAPHVPARAGPPPLRRVSPVPCPAGLADGQDEESRPPPALTIVGAEQSVPDGRWFCGYCGAEPAGGTPPPWQRVCEECSLGLLLEADAEFAPEASDAFLVIDSRLTVQALSRRAEQLLGVKEEDATDRPVGELLVDAAAEVAASETLSAAIARAASSDGGAWSGFVRPRHDFGIRTRVRVTHCGPPRAALLVLEDVGTPPPPLTVQSASRTESAQA